MKRKICPFYQKDCLQQKCMFWGDEYEVCFILERLIDLHVSKSKAIKDISKLTSREYDTPEYLEKSNNEIAEGLVNYCINIKPETSRWHDLNTVRDMFWESHEVARYNLSKENQLKFENIEELAQKMLVERKIPDFLRENSVDELAAQIMQQPMRRGRIPFHKIWDDPRMKGLETYDLPKELQDKIEQANDRARELRNEEQENKMRDKAIALVPELIKWCKSKNFPRVTKSGITVFLFERKLNLSMEARAYMHVSANEGYNLEP